MLVVAVDGEPLVVTAGQAAVQHAPTLVRAAPNATFVVGRGAHDVQAALAGQELRLVDEVVGCDRVAGAVHAADLIAPPDHCFLTVAGAVAVPGARLVPAAARVADVVALAGGATCGPAWVALGSTLRPAPLERDAAVAGLRAIVVAPGASALARRARGDLRALDPASPLGVDREWLGAFDPNAAAAAPLSLALVSRRLGFDPGSLAWPVLDPGLPLE